MSPGKVVTCTVHNELYVVASGCGSCRMIQSDIYRTLENAFKEVRIVAERLTEMREKSNADLELIRALRKAQWSCPKCCKDE